MSYFIIPMIGSLLIQANLLSSQFVTTVDPWTAMTQIPLSGDPRIECDSDQIRLIFDLLNPFNGILYPKNSYNHGETNCSMIGNGRSNIEYVIPLYGCGTISIQQEDGSINFRNVVILQNHNMLVTSSDRAYHIDCHYPLQEKTVSSNTNISMITTIGVLTGIPELPEPIMTIHVGKTPDSPLISGFVALGSFLTLKIRLMDESVYGFTVHTCYARDGLNWGEQLLIDTNGCPVNPAVFGPLQYDNINSITGAPSDGITRAFVMFASHKFPTSNSVYYECVVKLCPKSSCRIPTCNGQPEISTSEPIVITTEGVIEEITEGAIREFENNTLTTSFANTTLLPFILTNLSSENPSTTTFILTTSAIANDTIVVFANTSEAPENITEAQTRRRRGVRIGRGLEEYGENNEPELRVKGSVIILDDSDDDKSLTTEEGFKHPEEVMHKHRNKKSKSKEFSDSQQGYQKPKVAHRYRFAEPLDSQLDDQQDVTIDDLSNIGQGRGLDIIAKEMARVHASNREFCMSTAVFSVGIAIFICIFLAAITITSFLCLKTKKGLKAYKKEHQNSYVDPTFYPKYEAKSTISSSSGATLCLPNDNASFIKSNNSTPALSPCCTRNQGDRYSGTGNSSALSNAFHQHIPKGAFITKSNNKNYNGANQYR